jgi:hypothetical protein
MENIAVKAGSGSAEASEYDSATIAQLLDPYAEDFDCHQLHAELRMVHVMVKQTEVAVTTFADLIEVNTST